jgi:hypothetical protein
MTSRILPAAFLFMLTGARRLILAGLSIYVSAVTKAWFFCSTGPFRRGSQKRGRYDPIVRIRGSLGIALPLFVAPWEDSYSEAREP